MKNPAPEITCPSAISLYQSITPGPMRAMPRVVLTAEGGVIARGTLDTLLEREPLFQELWQSQSASPQSRRPAYAAKLNVATIAATMAR